MPAPPLDESLLPRLPLPLAQLCRRAHNARTALERHLMSFYLWEASIKLLSSVAVVEYVRGGLADPQLSERLHNLARPSLGHWRELIRLLVPVLAERGDAGFQCVRELVLGRSRDDLPRAAGLDAALRQALGLAGGARATVRLAELFDRVVQYRNKALGHGAAGAARDDFHQRMAEALLAGAVEVLGHLDVLAGRRLLHVAEIKQVGGLWIVQRYELTGETARRLAALELPRSEAARLPDGDRVYLLAEQAGSATAEMVALHPLVLFDSAVETGLFLNSRRGKSRTEYLCYTSGAVLERADLGGERRALLAQALGMAVAEEQERAWAETAQREEEQQAPAEENAPVGPRRMGEFELLSELGRGGMGVVFRAWQPSLRRQVALKTVWNVGGVSGDGRFRREIRALGKVDHPHLVKVYTSGSDGEHWFYAMELVEGVPLSDVSLRLGQMPAGTREVDLPTWQQAVTTACEAARKAEKPLSEPCSPREGEAPAEPDRALPRAWAQRAEASCPARQEPRPPEHAPAAGPGSLPAVSRGYVRQMVELVRQAAMAAHALHEAGVLHRDIKPGNIMVNRDGSEAVLMDLGLAQLADDVEGRLTRTRQFVGTLRYASPEQLGGASLDRRADVYSLGATLWELLALRPLFGVTEQTPTPDLILKLQRDEPERLRRCAPAAGRDLEAVVHRCLEKNPTARYASAEELARDLGRYLNGEPVRARPVRGLERALKWVRRRPTLAAAYGLLLLALVLGLSGGGAVWLWQQAEQARERAEDAEIAANKARHEAEDAEQSAKRAHGQLATVLREKVLLLGEREKALQEKDQALKQEALARKGEQEAREKLARLAYADRLNLAQREWEAGNFVPALQWLDECEEQHRGWEWHYLRRCWSPKMACLAGHTDQVNHVSFSPDGKRLASASADKTVRLWDALSGKPLCTLTGHTEPVSHVSFSPDGKRLASANCKRFFSASLGDKTVRLWDALSGKPLSTLAGHTDQVNHVSFSPDGKRLASASADKTVRLWDALSGKPLSTLTGHTDQVNHVSFSPDGKRLASASLDGTLRLWDSRSGKLLLTLPGHNGWVSQVSFSPDGKRLASASLGDKTVRLWDALSGKPLCTLTGHTDQVNHVSFSPDGKRLASASMDNTVRLWDVLSGKPLCTLTGHNGGVNHVSFSPDGKRLASGSGDKRLGSASGDKTVRLWDAHSGTLLSTLDGHTDSVHCVSFSPDGKRLASASSDNTVRLWDALSGKPLSTLAGHTEPVSQVSFSPDGKRLASASSKRLLSVSADKTVRLWDAISGKPLFTLAGHTDQVHHVSFSPDGKRLASASADKTVRLWDALSGKPLLTLTGHTGSVNQVSFSPDGKSLASASNDRTVRLWDALSGKPLSTLTGHTDQVYQVSFSPDGKRLASASADKTVRLWDALSGKPLSTLTGHTDQVNHVSFSPDGKRLASASWDHTVRLWDVLSGKPLFALTGHTEPVSHVSFSPDGKRLASASLGDKTVRLWDALSGKPLFILTGHTNWVTHVSFSPDGKRLASASADKTVRLWDVLTGKPLLTLTGHTGGVSHVSFSPDGKRLASAGWFTPVGLGGGFGGGLGGAIGGDNTVRLRIAQETPAEWEERLQVVQEQQAELAESERDWFAAAFHLGQLLSRQPEEAALWARRGSAFAEQDKWTEAAADFTEASRRQPNNPLHRRCLGLALLGGGDEDGYRAVCTTLLRQFPEPKDASTANSTAWLAVQRPKPPKQALALAQKAVDRDPRSWVYRETLGAAHYRAGDFTEAVRWLQGAARQRKGGAIVETLVFLAMAHHHLSEGDEAKCYLRQAEEQMKQEEKTNPPPNWLQRLWRKLLSQEANALIAPSKP